jgi:8-amino-7-oxononanoate synthase
LTAWAERLGARLEGIRDSGRWRSLRTLDGVLPQLVLDGRKVVSFAANDYLGLAGHPLVVAAAHAALDEWGLGAGASRLVVGHRGYHEQLEAELASWKRTEAALTLPTGFAANVGVLTAMADTPEVLIVSDELNHASIVDGCRMSRGTVAIARHADPGHVDDLLSAHGGPAVVVTDTVFSMDGDEAPIADLLDVCGRHGACLVLDEAHAVLGPWIDVAGAAALGVEVVRVGTLSKALGSVGGFVAASRPVIDLLVNVARPFIFTTGTTSADVAGALAALRIVRGAEGTELRIRLRSHIEKVAYGHPSPIVPIVLGDERAALAASARLLKRGLLVPAIRPPTVAVGTSRLRVALSAAHTDEQIDRLVRALAELPPAPGA